MITYEAMRRCIRAVGAASVMLTFAAAAQANDLAIVGTTFGAPVLERPATAGSFNYPASANYWADAAPYSVDAFWTDLDDHFDIFSAPIGGWDNFFALYQGTFDPAHPLQNLVFFNDDISANGRRGAGNQSTFEAQAGVQYFAVTTGVQGASGDYALHLASHGSIYRGLITPVPEPAEWVQLALGLAIVGASTRRRVRVGASS